MLNQKRQVVLSVLLLTIKLAGALFMAVGNQGRVTNIIIGFVVIFASVVVEVVLYRKRAVVAKWHDKLGMFSLGINVFLLYPLVLATAGMADESGLLLGTVVVGFVIDGLFDFVRSWML